MEIVSNSAVRRAVVFNQSVSADPPMLRIKAVFNSLMPGMPAVRAEGVACMESGMVMCGNEWWPGVLVHGFNPFINETIAYAINEGGVLFDTVPEDEDTAEWSWQVVRATSAQLHLLRRVGCKVPAGATITMADGRCFVGLENGKISDGSQELESMAGLSGDFVLEVCDGSF